MTKELRALLIPAVFSSLFYSETGLCGGGGRGWSPVVSSCHTLTIPVNFLCDGIAHPQCGVEWRRGHVQVNTPPARGRVELAGPSPCNACGRQRWGGRCRGHSCEDLTRLQVGRFVRLCGGIICAQCHAGASAVPAHGSAGSGPLAVRGAVPGTCCSVTLPWSAELR